MARIRTIKPELAAHEGLFDLEQETGLPIRFAWCMLFTVADRDGRFPWRPRTLKAQILPHDTCDFSRVLDAWVTRAFIKKYRVGNDWYGCIPTFARHQVINNRESPSEIPPIDDADEVFQPLTDACPTRDERVADACPTREVHALGEGRKEGKGREGRNLASFDASGVAGLDLQAWARWVEYRTEIRKPIKTVSREAAAQEMARLGDMQAAAVQNSIANGYQGLVPPKAENGARPTRYEETRKRALAWNPDAPTTNPLLIEVQR
jgi:hypothetical protein